jgi:hypothetical protein
VRTTVGAIIAARLRAVQAYPPPAMPDRPHHRGDVMEDEPQGWPSAERSSTASAARTVTEALTYRALVECAGCGARSRNRPRREPLPRPASDGRCTTCATASTHLIS